MKPLDAIRNRVDPADTYTLDQVPDLIGLSPEQLASVDRHALPLPSLRDGTIRGDALVAWAEQVDGLRQRGIHTRPGGFVR